MDTEMNQNELVSGAIVTFGRTHGEHTLGQVVRVNRKNVKVVQLEPRGSNKAHEVGSFWRVPKALVAPAKVPADRVEAGKKSVSEHPTPSSKVVELKGDSGINPVSMKQAREILRDIVLNSAGVSTENSPVVASPPVPKALPDEQGCPVLIDSVTQFRFVGHKGEELSVFIERIKSVLSH
jgi:hypothetical protein